MPLYTNKIVLPERYTPGLLKLLRVDNVPHITGPFSLYVPEGATAGDTLDFEYHAHGGLLLTDPSVVLVPRAKPPPKSILKVAPLAQATGPALRPKAEPSVLSGIRADCFIFLDLENLAFLATNLQPLSMRCKQLGVELRSYTSPGHDWAERATHMSRSNKREAADVRMVIDATRLIDAQIHRPAHDRRRCRILLVTDDLFGRTLAAEEPNSIACVAYNDILPDIWLGTVFGTEHASVEEYFESIGVVRERRGRSESQSRSQSRGRSQSRDGSQSRDRSASRDSRTRASWSRVASDHGEQAGAPSSLSRSAKRTQDHLLEKLNRQNVKIADLEHQLSLHRATAAASSAQASSREVQVVLSMERQLQLLTKAFEEETSKRVAAEQTLAEMERAVSAQRAAMDLSRAPSQPVPTARGQPPRRPSQRRGGPRRWPRGVEPSAGKCVGNVKYYNAEKGFGFIYVRALHGEYGDIFVHRSSIACDCEPSARLKNWDVELVVEPDARKPGKMKAANVSGPGGRQIPLLFD